MNLVEAEIKLAALIKKATSLAEVLKHSSTEKLFPLLEEYNLLLDDIQRLDAHLKLSKLKLLDGGISLVEAELILKTIRIKENALRLVLAREDIAVPAKTQIAAILENYLRYAELLEKGINRCQLEFELP